jgi:hypothetical protein
VSAEDDEYTEDEKQRIETMATIWFDQMSSEDRTSAHAAADPKRPDALHVMLTRRGSPNNMFWKQMVSLGWALPSNEAIEGLPEREELTAFSLNARGKAMLPKFLNVVN